MSTESWAAVAFPGATIKLGDAAFSIDSVLARHTDLSVTLTCWQSERGLTRIAAGGGAALSAKLRPSGEASHDNREWFVVRLFVDEPPSSGGGWLVESPGADHVWTYTYTGDAAVFPRGRGRVTRAWATVRRFTKATLKDALEALPSPRVDALVLALDLARGLDTLHRNQIVHGDLRPSNVHWGAGGPAQLMDYGTANSWRGNLSRELSVELAGYLAPELLVAGAPGRRAQTPQSDIYSYGKLIRQIASAFRPREEANRMLLAELVEECLLLDPRARLPIASVLARLTEQVTTPWTALTLGRLRGAVLADIDARLTSGLPTAASADQISSALSRSSRLLANDLTRRPSTRADQLSPLEMTHFLASMTLMSHPKPFATEPDPFSRRYEILRAASEVLEPGRNAGSGGEGGASQPEIDIDPQWRDEVEAQTRADLEGRDLAEAQIELRVQTQVDGATELSRSMLKSDLFMRSAEAAAVMSRRCPGITQDEVRILKDLGYLLALPIGDSYYYPSFQFNVDGLPRDCIKLVSDQLRPDQSTWGSSVWWFLSSRRLGGTSPARWLRDGGEEDRVVRLLTKVVA